MGQKTFKHREVAFLSGILEEEELGKIGHPIVGAVMGQVVKLFGLLDNDKGAVVRIHNVLNKIQERWVSEVSEVDNANTD